jgi:DNA-binding transcriptional ArsR family regulator
MPTTPLDGIFAALGEPTRLAMVERLARGGATVGELAAPFDVSLQAIIKHIKVLEEAGLVQRTRVGRTNHVALVPGALQVAAGWLNARVPLALPAAPLPVAVGRRQEIDDAARALRGRLAPRMALVRRALAGPAPAADAFDPADATVRALQAAFDMRPALEEALALYDALSAALDAPEPELDDLRDLALPLARAVYGLRPLLAG